MGSTSRAVDDAVTSPDSLSFLAGGGEMGALMRALDWSATALGPPEQWPQSLRTAVGILLNSRYPMFIAWGAQLNFLYNDGYRPIFGQKHPAALGQPFAQIWAEIWDDLQPLVNRALAGEPTWSEDLQLMMARSAYIEETYFTFSYSPIPNEAGGVGGMFCACTETTGRVIGERRLRLLRDLAAGSRAAENIGDVSARLFNVLDENRLDVPFARLYMSDRSGQRMRDVGGIGELPGRLRPAEIDLNADHTPWPVREVLESGAARIVELNSSRVACGPWTDPIRHVLALPIKGRGAATDGVLIAAASPRRALDENYESFFGLLAGQFSAAIGSAQAYESERRRADALAELDRAKTTFFSNISHELRTPLTLLMGPIEDALNEVDGASHQRTRDGLSLAQRNARRLLRLVNTLLDFSRIEAGRVQAVFELTDLAAFTSELASNFRSACERAGLELVVDCPPLASSTFVDRDMWEKIVLNLISNAFKYTLHGRITVAQYEAAEHVRLVVSDTGSGVAEDALPHMFERFYRAPGAQGRTHEGTGIGLALVQELVKLHGGSVDIASTLGVGTTLTVTIPHGRAHLPGERVTSGRAELSTRAGAEAFVEEALRWLPDGEREVPSESRIIDPSPGLREAEPPGDREPRARVLVVDDNADMREYVRRLLGQRFIVATAVDGVDAHEQILREPPELVLTDIMMPRLDGFGLLKRLRDAAATRELPVILLSARAGEEASVEGLSAGADDYLIKPFSARELVARVEAHVKLAQLRREAALARRESEERFRAMADQAPVMIWVTDTDGRCTYLSKSWYAFTGQTPTDGLGFGWLNATHPDDGASASQIFMEANAAREPFRMEYRLRRSDGVYRWAIDSAVPRFGSEGEFLGYIGSVIDITEIVEARQTLEEAGKRKDEFLAMLAHELRNPLAPIRNAASVLSVGRSDPATVAKLTQIIERQATQLTRLVDDLLDVARVAQGAVKLRNESVEVASIVDRAIETVRPLFNLKHQEVMVSPSPTPLHVHADPARLAQIVANLLNNAAKYSPERTTIQISLAREAQDAVIRVRDEGVGIDPSLLKDVFDLFVQAERSLDRSQGGLGIGLNVVKRLVELHGGRVEAVSEGPNRGSEFIVRLPLVHPLRDGAPDAPAEPIEPRPVSRRILLVEDNRDAAESLVMLLQIDRHEVEHASDAYAALETLKSFKPDLMLIDIGLPGLDGYELARTIRRSAHGSTKLYALTGYGQEDDRARALEAGFDGHLTKPVGPKTLLALVGNPM